MSGDLRHSKEGLREAFDVHLMYEIDMLRATYTCLASESLMLLFSDVLKNSLIESFCIHARNLIEFFDEKSATPGQSDGRLGAKHFTTDFTAWDKGGPSNDLRNRLNKQVSHLTYDRTKSIEEKVGLKESEELMRLLGGEIDRFLGYLREPYKPPAPLETCPNPLDNSRAMPPPRGNGTTSLR